MLVAWAEVDLHFPVKYKTEKLRTGMAQLL